MNVRTLIGESVHRAEDFRFLKGTGSFVDDLRREGMLHAAVLRSPVAHGRIRGIDARAARAVPGVHAVVTAKEIGAVPVIPLRLANLPEFKDYLQPVIAEDKVRYVGEPVALVVAGTPCSGVCAKKSGVCWAGRSLWWWRRRGGSPRMRSKRSSSISSACRRCR